MPVKKGKTNNPNGRPKGSKNVATTKVREAMAKFANETVDDFTGWLKEVAQDDKKGACELYLKVIEYHIPKLSRVESKVEGEVSISGLLSRLPDADK